MYACVWLAVCSQSSNSSDSFKIVWNWFGNLYEHPIFSPNLCKNSQICIARASDGFKRFDVLVENVSPSGGASSRSAGESKAIDRLHFQIRVRIPASSLAMVMGVDVCVFVFFCPSPSRTSSAYGKRGDCLFMWCV